MFIAPGNKHDNNFIVLNGAQHLKNSRKARGNPFKAPLQYINFASNTFRLSSIFSYLNRTHTYIRLHTHIDTHTHLGFWPCSGNIFHYTQRINHHSWERKNAN